MSDTKSTIIYTLTDEAPALATRSLLPIIKTFTDSCGVAVETSGISITGLPLGADLPAPSLAESTTIGLASRSMPHCP